MLRNAVGPALPAAAKTDVQHLRIVAEHRYRGIKYMRSNGYEQFKLTQVYIVILTEDLDVLWQSALKIIGAVITDLKQQGDRMSFNKQGNGPVHPGAAQISFPAEPGGQCIERPEACVVTLSCNNGLTVNDLSNLPGQIVGSAYVP